MFGKDTIASLLDYSQRNSNKNMKQNTNQSIGNPYLFEIINSNNKKFNKKKSESIDLVKIKYILIYQLLLY